MEQLWATRKGKPSIHAAHDEKLSRFRIYYVEWLSSKQLFTCSGSLSTLALAASWWYSAYLSGTAPVYPPASLRGNSNSWHCMVSLGLKLWVCWPVYWRPFVGDSAVVAIVARHQHQLACLYLVQMSLLRQSEPWSNRCLSQIGVTTGIPNIPPLPPTLIYCYTNRVTKVLDWQSLQVVILPLLRQA